MIYYRVDSIPLLEDELKKLNAAYVLALKRPVTSTSISDLRKMIKAIKGRINKLSNC